MRRVRSPQHDMGDDFYHVESNDSAYRSDEETADKNQGAYVGTRACRLARGMVPTKPRRLELPVRTQLISNATPVLLGLEICWFCSKVMLRACPTADLNGARRIWYLFLLVSANIMPHYVRFRWS